MSLPSGCRRFTCNLRYFALSSPYRSFNSANSFRISLQWLRGQGRVDFGCFSANPWASSFALLLVIFDELAEWQNSFLGEDLVDTSCFFAFGVSLNDSRGEDLVITSCFLAFGVSLTDSRGDLHVVATSCFFAFGVPLTTSRGEDLVVTSCFLAFGVNCLRVKYFLNLLCSGDCLGKLPSNTRNSKTIIISFTNKVYSPFSHRP